MNSEFQKRLYEMEVMPPAAVWEKLSVNIDEINADNSIAKKVLGASLTPPVAAWENISIAIGTEEKKEPVKRGVVINFKRLAAAAIFIGSGFMVAMDVPGEISCCCIFSIFFSLLEFVSVAVFVSMPF